MTVKEFIQNMGRKSKERKELLRKMKEQDYLENKIQEMKLSSNERELNRYVKENREEQVKKQLDYYRKKRDADIKFNHNPLNVKNITNHTDWQVLKERNMFKGNNNIFTNQQFIHKSNRKLLNSGNCLKGKYLFKGGKSL